MGPIAITKEIDLVHYPGEEERPGCWYFQGYGRLRDRISQEFPTEEEAMKAYREGRLQFENA